MSSPPDQAQETLQQMMQLGQSLTEAYLGFLTKPPFPFPTPRAPATPAVPPAMPNLDSLAKLQQELLSQHAQLWQTVWQRKPDEKSEPLIEPPPGDRRFRAPEWEHLPLFDYLRQAYLLNADFLTKLAETIPIEEGPAKTRMRFATRLLVEAMAPSNFAATNPEFVKTALATKGESITGGLKNLLEDLQKGRISMTDESAFEIGRNIVTTPGSVIYENPLMQLIQYRPTTATVAERPLLMVPPCINKYYLMDLQPENSFVGYVVEQGFTVFLISWRSATEEMGRLTWDDYVEMGPLTALRVVREITGVDRPNVLGFCIGGPIACSALAVLRARGEDPAESLTLMTSLLDYSEPGEIGALVTEPAVASYEATIGQGGILHGRDLAAVFSSLRSNDLIWQYVVGNYLKGETPRPFDLLYWNSDSTNLAGPAFTWYLRNMYLANNFRLPGKLEVLGEKLDLGKIAVPSYLMAAREDHLVPWQGAFLSRKVLGGPTTFVLAASGHIAGSINPASKNRRSYWVNDGDATLNSEEWLAGAGEQKGSWWIHWTEWLRQRSGNQVPAPETAGNAHYREIEPAPGRYVKEKAN